MDFELQVKGLESIDKKLQKLEKAAKTGDKDSKRGVEVLSLFKSHIESFQSARTLKVSKEDRKYTDDIFLPDRKACYVCL